MANVQYKTSVEWDATLADVGFSTTLNPITNGLAISATKITTGAPAAIVGRWLPSAMVQNAVSGVIYINAGSTASPSWEAIEAGTIALARGFILVGNASGVAVALDANNDGFILVGNGTDLNSVAVSGDALLANTGALTVTGTTAERVAFIPATAPQELSGPGAVNITAYQTRFTSTGTGDALTLANATRIGLLKKVTYVAEGGGADTGVITPATPSGFATVTLNAIGDYVQFMWTGAAWIVVDYVGATVA